MERSLFSILSPGNRIWSVLSYDLPHVYQRADRRNRPIHLAGSTTSISLSDRIGRRDSSYNTATNLIWPAKLSSKCSLATKIYWHWLRPRNEIGYFERSWFAYGRGWSTYDQIPNIVGSRSSTHGNMRSRFYPVWDRSWFYETSTRITFIFFVTFVQITFGDMGDHAFFMLER
jgi:hypothetical protein